MVGVPMLKHEKTLCSNPKLFVLKPVSQRLSNTPACLKLSAASQHPVPDWHQRLGGGTHVDGILERVVYDTTVVETG